MNIRAIGIIGVAGLITNAAGVPTVHITTDAGTVNYHDTITWTVSVTGLSLQTIGGITLGGDYVQAYDFTFIPSAGLNGTAGAFVHFAGSVTPTPGTPNDAMLVGVAGGQSSILGGVQYGDLVLGTFTVQVEPAFEGEFTYSLADGGVLAETNTLQIKNYDFFAPSGQPNGDFGPDVFNGVPTVISERILFYPTPGTLGVLALAPVVVRRRRR